MKPSNQTNEACRSNVGRDFGGVQSMFMVITQPKLITNSRDVKYQRIKESVCPIWCFAIKQVVKMPEEACLA